MTPEAHHNSCHLPSQKHNCHSPARCGGGRCRCEVSPGEWAVRARVERFIEPALLLLLRERPRHGYELLELVPSIVGEDGQVDVGNVYRLLRRLEQEAFLTSEWRSDLPGPAKRTYTLTETGRKLLARWAEALGDARTRIDSFLTTYAEEEGHGTGTLS
jgi:PadR family transcriptional regulator PadR